MLPGPGAALQRLKGDGATRQAQGRGGAGAAASSPAGPGLSRLGAEMPEVGRPVGRGERAPWEGLILPRDSPWP